MTEPNKRTIGLIWSQTPDGIIGANGGIPWEIPEDAAHFQAVTGGRTVIMGRKTWDALPEQARTAPDRRTIVLTRDPEWFAAGAERAGSVTEALELTDPDEVWVIGGAEILAAAIEFATVITVTEVHVKAEGDAHAPTIPSNFIMAFTTGTNRSSTGKDTYLFRSYAHK
jgi:dihydrofolate reductase